MERHCPVTSPPPAPPVPVELVEEVAPPVPGPVEEAPPVLVELPAGTPPVPVELPAGAPPVPVELPVGAPPVPVELPVGAPPVPVERPAGAPPVPVELPVVVFVLGERLSRMTVCPQPAAVAMTMRPARRRRTMRLFIDPSSAQSV
jgi:hypothetical protein